MQRSMPDDFKIFGDESSVPTTRIAPAERAPREEVEASLKSLSAEPLLKAVLDVLGANLMILNRQRQIVIASQELLKEFNVLDSEALAGFRPGEALKCVHAWETPSGCGTSEACSTCGAVSAIMQSQESGITVERECLLTVRTGDIEDARELRLRASPLVLRGETYTLISLTDISQEKRRETLEKVFFHDILNTIAGLNGWSKVLGQGTEERREAAADRLRFLIERLYREIEDQRILLMAERGTLQVRPALVQPGLILDAVEGIFNGHEVSRGKHLEVLREGSDDQIYTDDSMVVRVLVNMVKNALEATPIGGTVRLWTRSHADQYEFLVWNVETIPRHIALQIFRRSFSTKAEKGRGIGTFSMKLFGERYLGGKVCFSSDQKGTVFSLALPQGFPQHAAMGSDRQ